MTSTQNPPVALPAPAAPPIPTVEPAPDSRLAQLAALYAQVKPAADAAAAQLKDITDAIKAELAAAKPGALKVDLASPLLEAPLRLQAKTSWGLDTKKFKAEAPEVYVRYAVQRTSWELRAVSA
jgi:hypothetical protein